MAKKTLTTQHVTRSNRKYCSFSYQEILYIICVTILCCGDEFSYDVPGSLQVIMTKIYKLTSSQYSLFYSCYALPNIFLCLFGGYLIDRILGIKISTVLCMVVAMSGSILFAFGGFMDAFWIMLLGRLFFGLGIEMGASVCLNYLTFTRFKNTNVNLVFSVSDNFGYIGSTAVYQISYRLYDYFNQTHSEKQSLNLVLLITSCVFLLSAVCGILMTYLKPNDDLIVIPQEEPEVIKENDISEEEKPPIELMDIVKFPPIFWLLCFASACFANSVYTFEAFSQELWTKVYGLKVEEASNITLVLNMTKIVFSIPLSMIVDRVGRNTIFVLFAVLTSILSHVSLLMNINPYICMSLLGVSYTMMGSSIVPMFAYPLSKSHYGLCYGIVTSISNVSLFTCPLIAGYLIDTYGYKSAEIFYLSGLTVGLLCIMRIWILDRRSNGILIMTPEERIAYENRPMEKCKLVV